MTLSTVGEQVEDAAAVASEAAEEAEQSKSLGELLDHDIQLLRDRADRSPVEVFFQLRHERQRVWVFFLNDAEFRPTKQTPRLHGELREILEAPIDPNDWIRNGTELAFWKDFLAKRNQRGRMTAWAGALSELGQFEPITALPLGDEDGIRRLRAEFRKKRTAKCSRSLYPDNEIINNYKVERRQGIIGRDSRPAATPPQASKCSVYRIRISDRADHVVPMHFSRYRNSVSKPTLATPGKAATASSAVSTANAQSASPHSRVWDTGQLSRARVGGCGGRTRKTALRSFVCATHRTASLPCAGVMID